MALIIAATIIAFLMVAFLLAKRVIPLANKVSAEG